MTMFDERERAYEARFAHDAEMRFRVEARRNRLLGLWAAGLLGRTGDAADAYAREVVRADFHEAGEAEVLRKLEADLGARADAAAIRAKMAELGARARAELDAEG